MNTSAKPNEPGQAALDATNLSRIRRAITEAGEANEVNNKVKNRLRGIYAQTSLQNLNNDAARTALKLIEGGDEAIDKYLADHEKVAIYVGYLGKTLSKRQFELFGVHGTGPAPEDERATNEGRAAGFKLDDEQGSKETDSPYEIGSIKGQAWLAAFRQARIERNDVLAMPQPQAGTEAENDDTDEEPESEA